MKTILITGGASGLGKGIAIQQLKEGNRVIVIGSSTANGASFIRDVKQSGYGERAVFLQADLSLIKENQRVIKEVKQLTSAIDTLIFCASKHNKHYIETADGLEFGFALDYLSRFILSYGLKELLENSEHPVILNVCGTGMDGEVNWNDLQHQTNFDPQKAMMHGSRLNDLSAVAFIGNDNVGKIKYILYNPWAVQTSGMREFFKNPLIWQFYKIIGKSVDKAAGIITELLNSPLPRSLSAYRERKKLSLSKPTYDKASAQKLYTRTRQLLEAL